MCTLRLCYCLFARLSVLLHVLDCYSFEFDIMTSKVYTVKVKQILSTNRIFPYAWKNAVNHFVLSFDLLYRCVWRMCRVVNFWICKLLTLYYRSNVESTMSSILKFTRSHLLFFRALYIFITKCLRQYFFIRSLFCLF